MSLKPRFRTSSAKLALGPVKDGATWIMAPRLRSSKSLQPPEPRRALHLVLVPGTSPARQARGGTGTGTRCGIWWRRPQRLPLERETPGAAGREFTCFPRRGMPDFRQIIGVRRSSTSSSGPSSCTGKSTVSCIKQMTSMGTGAFGKSRQQLTIGQQRVTPAGGTTILPARWCVERGGEANAAATHRDVLLHPPAAGST